jgi:uncharacterized repeat protein (TIGR01451 family)
MKKLLIALAAATMMVPAAPALAAAQQNVQLTSNMMVERVTKTADGKEQRKLEEPESVVPGDVIVFQISYKNAGSDAATEFVVTNPLPTAITFAGGESNGADLSVDGGQNWGQLANLQVKQADGTMRAAQPADVTHIRWAFSQPIPAGQSGQLSFKGVVK